MRICSGRSGVSNSSSGHDTGRFSSILYDDEGYLNQVNAVNIGIFILLFLLEPSPLSSRLG